MAKKVLVSYLDRNKVFDIPNDIENDIEYLTAECLKAFRFETN